MYFVYFMELIGDFYKLFYESFDLHRRPNSNLSFGLRLLLAPVYV